MLPAEPTAETHLAVTAPADGHPASGDPAEPGTRPATLRPHAGPDGGDGGEAGEDASRDDRTDGHGESSGDAHGEDTMDLRLPDEFFASIEEAATGFGGSTSGESSGGAHHWLSPSDHATSRPAIDDLLDGVAGWGPVRTPAGAFHLVPVRLERDLRLISRWMNDPAAAAFWELSGPQSVAEGHIHAQLTGDGRSVPCIGVLDGRPMSYWEIYRADLDPLARFYPARPHDTGLHLLLGEIPDRGRGLGGLLLRAVADLVLAQRPSCARVIAEPDIRNTPSIAAFLTAGFRLSVEIDLPGKTGALMIRERSLRHVL
ncbi:GNAT family N-acetyltransferase [Streptomyces sp. NPDC004830]